jgi:hypothetical protein
MASKKEEYIEGLQVNTRSEAGDKAITELPRCMRLAAILNQAA